MSRTPRKIQVFQKMLDGLRGTTYSGKLDSANSLTILDRISNSLSSIIQDTIEYDSTAQAYKINPDSLPPRRAIISNIFHGQLTDEQIFGDLYLPHIFVVEEARASAQVAPVGAAATFDLVDGTNAEQSKIITLTDGVKRATTTFTPFEIPAQTAWALKVKQVGSTTPGALVDVRLIGYWK